MHVSEALSLLVDPDRLAVAGALAVAPLTTDELIERTSRDRRTVLNAVGSLRQAGLVAAEAERFTLDLAALRDLAQAAADVDLPMDPAIGYGMTAEERGVLERFFSGRALTQFPNNRAKQQIVLQRIALEFDVGRRYSEPEVNEILHTFHTDWSTLRRHLIDEQLLDREHRDGQTWYWRSGGRVLSGPISDER